MKQDTNLNTLRITALVVLVCGAVASLGFTLWAGRNNKSIILPLMFAFWVLSPFAAFIRAAVFKAWPAGGRKVLYALGMVVAAVSVVAYSGIVTPPGFKPTPIFLLVPLAAWLAIALARLTAGKSTKNT